MDLKQLAYKNRVQKVNFTVDDQEYNLKFVIPVFLQALKFQSEYSSVIEKFQHVSTLYGDLNLVPPLRSDCVSDEHYKQVMSDYNDHIENLDKEDKDQVAIHIREFNVAVEKFAVEWLPIVCEDFSKLNEEEISGVIRQTGKGLESPLVEGLARLNGSIDNPSTEGLDDLPF